MVNLFRLDASIQPDVSTTRSLADRVEARFAAALRADNEQLTVVRRDIGTEPLPATAWATSLATASIPDDQRTAPQREVAALSTTLVDELEQAAAYLFAVPLYNWGVSQHVKTWVDLLTTNARFAPGSQPIAGRPAVLVTARGGTYAAGTPRADWDHATAWYRRIFEDVWGLDVQVISVELTLAPRMDYLAGFRDQAAASLESGMERATELGDWLAERLPVASTI